MGKIDLSDIQKAEKKGILSDSGKKKVGRPKKSEAEKLSETISVNFTKAEKQKLLELSKQNMVPVALPTLIRYLLKQGEYI